MASLHHRGVWSGWGAICALLGLLLSARAAALPSVQPTGVTLYDPDRAYNGYVLFSGGDQHTHLIDMNGNEVRRWEQRGFPSLALTAEQAGGARGHVLLQLADVERPARLAAPGNGLNNAVIGEVDWNGQVVWQWGSQAAPAHQNHDIRRLDNGNTLVLSSLRHALDGFSVPEVVDNLLYEIDTRGEVVWRWLVSDHLEELGFSPEQLDLVRQSDDPDFLHLNTAAPLGPNRWFDAGDERFAPDNILINSRNANVVALIDKASGKIVWRLGPDYPPLKGEEHNRVPRPLDQLVGAHDVHMIPPGLPGAGHLLIFDNQGNAGFPPARQGVFSASRVLEVDPRSKQIVWQYKADMSGQAPWAFYSAFISSARRLPNGNTLIDEGQHGRLFQVTPEGDIVWEYISPYAGKQAPTDDYTTNAVYRAQPVDYAWAPDGTPHEERGVTPEDGR